MKKLLIVEDDKNILNALHTYFSRKEFVIETATNAKSVLDIIDRYVPDLLITDWKLGSDVDGADIALIVAKKNKNVVIIFITGHQVEKLSEKISDIKVHKIIRKPFEFSEIDDSVKSAFV